MLRIFLVVSLVGFFCMSSHAQAFQSLVNEVDVQQQVKAFAHLMATEHQFDEQAIVSQLSSLKQREDIIARISKPAESLPWYRYRKIFITPKRIDAGVKFWNQNAQTLQKAAGDFGVDPAIIVGIIGIETFYGRNLGDFPVLEALHTLGFYYPKRAEFFRSELAQFYLLAREENWQLTDVKGSYAGAMGMGQFISSSYRQFGFDFDGNGKVDLFSDPVDMIGSVAHYFKGHQWRENGFVIEPVKLNESQLPLLQEDLQLTRPLSELQQAGIDTSRLQSRSDVAGLFAFERAKDVQEYWLAGENFYAITRYNHSALYALAVFQLSQAITEKYNAQNHDELVQTDSQTVSTTDEKSNVKTSQAKGN